MKKLCALFIVLCVLIGCVGCAVKEMGINKDLYPTIHHPI